MTKIAGTYKIQSKLKPDDVLLVGTSKDLAGSMEYHLCYLRLRIHPNPFLMNHTLKFGIADLQFTFYPDEEVEKAVVNEVKERRKRIAET
jgi:hypothetical protein